MTTISGNPTALREYSETTLAMLPALEEAVAAVQSAVSAYNSAPSDMAHTAVLACGIDDHAARLAELDTLPAAFAYALRQSDQMGPLIVHTMGSVEFEDLAGLWLSQHGASGGDPDTTDQLADGFLAELFSVYSAGGEPGPLKVGLGALRVFRTNAYLRFALDAGRGFTASGTTLGLPRLLPASASAFPTTNTGLIGRALSGVAPWLQSPTTTATLRWAGVAGGAYGTVTGVMNLVEQGNPVDAFQENGAGYVADVSGTLFSASTTAFLIAPNPITGGAVIVTGVVWAGAEIWDHREAIADWTGDRWDDVSDWTGDRVDDVADWGSDRLDDLGSAASTVNDHMPWNW